jgi:hypothetical protein
MSYIQKYSDTIHVRIPFSYPASQSGGSSSVSADVPISWTVNVDTDPFDESILITENQVDELTGSVQEAGVANVEAIKSNADAISSTIVGGFFSYIRSDLSQQTSELRPKVEAKMVQLIKLHEACRGKIAQMSQDFNRIAERYTKIFDALDTETKNRILALSGKLFSLEKIIKGKIDKPSSESLFAGSTISNLEIESLTSLLFGLRIKGGAKLIIERTKNLLLSDRTFSKRINSILSTEKTEDIRTIYLPVIVLGNSVENGTSDTQLYYSQRFEGFQQQNFKNRILELVHRANPHFTQVDKNDLFKIEEYFKNEITTRGENSDAHTNRILENAWKMWKNNFNSLAK